MIIFYYERKIKEKMTYIKLFIILLMKFDKNNNLILTNQKY